MPKVMKNADWMRTVENVRKSDGIWFDDIVSHSGTIPLSVPVAGRYHVILVKIDDTPQLVVPKKPCIRDFIGYGKRFNPNIGTTAEIMKELREGEEP